MDGFNNDFAARAQLQRLLALARDNEEKLRRFSEQELRLIATPSLREVVTHIVGEFPVAFGVDCVTLALVDPQEELADMLADGALAPAAAAHLLFVKGDGLAPVFGGRNGPVLGRFNDLHAPLFPGARNRIASVALLPLRRGAECIGSLNFGSADARRYAPGSCTDFLERLAAIVAICIENGANHERVRRLGFTDPLTGVNNRRYLDERIGEAFAAAARAREPLACMFLDVDHFKRFNDRHGHAAGDHALRVVAQRMRAELRRGDVLCRYGGEEFVALLPCTDAHTAREVAERIRAAVADYPFTLDGGRSVTLSLSIGVAACLPDLSGPAVAALLQAADAAVYAAKEAGRDRVVIAGQI
ncbi:MAG: DUF484 family protein [Thiohalomonadaceae bacterium]